MIIKRLSKFCLWVSKSWLCSLSICRVHRRSFLFPSFKNSLKAAGLRHYYDISDTIVLIMCDLNNRATSTCLDNPETSNFKTLATMNTKFLIKLVFERLVIIKEMSIQFNPNAPFSMSWDIKRHWFERLHVILRFLMFRMKQ